MLNISLLSLTCALTSGVFGFGADAPDGWTWEKGSFAFFLLLAAISFVGSTMSRPSLLWEVLDEIQGRQFQNRMPTDQRGHAYQAIEFLPTGVIWADSAERDTVASDGDITCSRRKSPICPRVLECI